MTLLTKILIVLGTTAFMEAFAWWAHKYVMHGFGWGWHKSHHVVTPGRFEKNDLYAVVFSFIAMGLFFAGTYVWEPVWYVALGVTLYGILYGFVHDGLVHQRWPFNYSPKNKYLRRLVHAHRIHHHTTTQHGAVSFGFLWAENPEILTAKLKANQGRS